MFKAGDRVVIVEPASSRYVGLTGTVIYSIDRTTKVRMDEPFYNIYRGIEQSTLSLYHHKLELIEPRKPNWEV